MAEIIPVAHNLDQGFQSDVSRDELGQTAAYRLRDWILQLEAPARKRGGWSYGSPDLGSVGGLAASVASIGFLPFPGDGHLVAISNAGSAYQLKQFDGAGGSVITDTGDTSIVPSWPVFWHKTGTVYYGIVLGGLTQTAKVPKRYYDTGGRAYTMAALGGTPPKARMGFSWGDYLTLGNYYDPSDADTLKNYRWAFSAPGDPNSWALSGVNQSTLDFPEEVIAGVPLRNLVLAWGYNDLHILTGDTPPPGGNLALNVLYAGLGTIDGRTVQHWRDYAVWANAAGVYQSDGSTLTDLTAQGGISVYYRQLVSGFAFTDGWSATAGIYRDHYVLTIKNDLGVVVTTLVCDLARRVWTEWTNFPGGIFAHRPAGPGTALFGGDEELFFAHSSSPRVGKVSTLWTPSSTYANDGDGTAVLPEIEFGFFKLGTDALKRFRRAFMGYDLRAAGGGSYLKMSYTLDPGPNPTYIDLSDHYPETTNYRRKQGAIGQMAGGIGLKLTQVLASADTRFYDLSLEAHPMDPSRASA